ncbi:MAG: outer membrane lipoprotein-sorting protein, partial [Myxococcota bacterium]
GTATLKAKDDLFTYLAKTGRTIKIAGAMMGSSWMGSHLNNNDLVKAARVADNYDLKVAGKGTIDGVPHYVLTATAKRDAAVVWGKIEVMIRTEDLLPTRQIFYDEDGTAIRIMEFEDYQMSGDRKLAKRMVISPLDGSGEFTRVEFKKMDFDVEVPESLFTIQHLKSI